MPLTVCKTVVFFRTAPAPSDATKVQLHERYTGESGMIGRLSCARPGGLQTFSGEFSIPFDLDERTACDIWGPGKRSGPP